VGGDVLDGVESSVKTTGGGFTLRAVCMRRRVGPFAAGDSFCPDVRTRPVRGRKVLSIHGFTCSVRFGVHSG
jgi:hypothetical protein